MFDYLTVYGNGRVLTIEEIVYAMLLAFVLSAVFAAVYRFTFQGLSYSRAFVQTMILGSMVVAMLIMAIGNNLARGLGILGTLAIVRFRTPIRDSRDMMFLFASLGVGIACGAGVMEVAIIGTGLISAAALVMHVLPFASRREYEGLLRFILPPDSEIENEVEDVLRHCSSAFHLIAMREAAQGDLIEYSYQIRLIDPSYQSDLVDKLHKIDGVTDASLLMQRTTVEL
jgi:uncharacterized membrane protein YhiD involved in acid resistance